MCLYYNYDISSEIIKISLRFSPLHPRLLQWFRRAEHANSYQVLEFEHWNWRVWFGLEKRI